MLTQQESIKGGNLYFPKYVISVSQISVQTTGKF